jgi:hypothetical protein
MDRILLPFPPLEKNMGTIRYWKYLYIHSLFGVALMQSIFFKSLFYIDTAIGTRVKDPLVYFMDNSIKPCI